MRAVRPSTLDLKVTVWAGSGLASRVRSLLVLPSVLLTLHPWASKQAVIGWLGRLSWSVLHLSLRVAGLMTNRFSRTLAVRPKAYFRAKKGETAHIEQKKQKRNAWSRVNGGPVASGSWGPEDGSHHVGSRK
jgi:hypothetical protein